jgi:hypothetical protein
VRRRGGRIQTMTMEIFQSDCHNKTVIYLFQIFFPILLKTLVRTGVSASHLRKCACLRMCVHADARASVRM